MGAAALDAGIIPDDESLVLVIGLEPVLAARPLVHDDAQAPSSTPVRSASLRGQLCSGGGTAH